MNQKKNIKYKTEQEEILNNLIKKIGFNKENNRVLKEQIETDEIKKYILSIQDNIKKYYAVGNWASIYKKTNIEMNIIRNIFKEHNIEILKIEKKRKNEENKYESYRVYVFLFPEESK